MMMPGGGDDVGETAGGEAYPLSITRAATSSANRTGVSNGPSDRVRDDSINGGGRWWAPSGGLGSTANGCDNVPSIVTDYCGEKSGKRFYRTEEKTAKLDAMQRCEELDE